MRQPSVSIPAREGSGRPLTALPCTSIPRQREIGQIVAYCPLGSVFSATERRELAQFLTFIPRDTSPFTNPVDLPAHWVEPRLIAEVAMSSWTTAGRLRHPVWHRLRPDLTRGVKQPGAHSRHVWTAIPVPNRTG
ncbi:ATP dependent DNA ligase [Streptomyces sp. NPDC055025]